MYFSLYRYTIYPGYGFGIETWKIDRNILLFRWYYNLFFRLRDNYITNVYTYNVILLEKKKKKQLYIYLFHYYYLYADRVQTIMRPPSETWADTYEEEKKKIQIKKITEPATCCSKRWRRSALLYRVNINAIRTTAVFINKMYFFTPKKKAWIFIWRACRIVR